MPRWRFAHRLAHAALQDPPESPSGPATISLEEARSIAFGLRTMRNAALAASRVSTARGELTCWRRAIPALPEDYLEGVDMLEMFQERLIAELRTDQAAIAPHIAELTQAQPSQKCWSRPVPEDAQRGTWAGKDSWVTHAHTHLAPLMVGPSMAISAPNLRSILQAMAGLVSPTGRGLTASHATIAKNARQDHGCALALSTATQRTRTARRLLEHAGFLLTHARGGHMTSLERMAALAHHGGCQNRCGSTCDLILPEHLRPTPPQQYLPDSGLAERLQERDEKYLEHRKSTVVNSIESTYVSDLGFESSIRYSGVFHARARAEKNFISSQKVQISTRSWTIADALTHDSENAAARGPYAHLVGDGAGQISLKSVAFLIEKHTPAWADLRTVMRGLAHAATGKTGYVALGLKTRPRRAWPWLETVLESISWDDQAEWPAWSVAAREFGVDWRGARHRWGKDQKANPQEKASRRTASADIGRSAIQKMREIIAKAKSAQP
ncbi:hypothetical protein [Corynebacterium glutamicum]|uniref:hypothetical protein n=1 Tax=Corynebacterium glutamicum TaxID=1718 RepID=UPI000771F43F|nr:hypothetical protein [Corynebacterium glutamicum]AMK79452.1 hypothetical protein APT58_15270 [Corynebacterium glutamicum]